MRGVSEGSVIVAAAGSINNTGVIPGTGVDWAPNYEPYVNAHINLGVMTAAGSLVVDIQGSNTLGSGYVSLGSLAVAGAPAGTQCYSVTVDNPYRYARAVETITAGSVTVATN